MADHSPEPWETRPDPDLSRASDVFSQDVGYPGQGAVNEVATGVDEEDARRIVACVNFCAGSTTEDLEQGEDATPMNIVRWDGTCWEFCPPVTVPA